MILFWGVPKDEALNRVYQILQQRQQAVAFLDQRNIREIEMDLSLFPEVKGSIRWPEVQIPIQGISAAYIRPIDVSQFPFFKGVAKDDPTLLRSITIHNHLFSWADIAPCHILNRPSSMISNHSKPFQAALIRKAGFLTPRTIISTSPKQVLAFFEQEQTILCKSISSVRSISRIIGKDRLSDLNSIQWCPTQFQTYITGTEYRVHVVGHRVFAAKIISESADYRYGQTKIQPSDLPLEVKEICLTLSHQLELPLCGIDLKRTESGEWFCFEVNPSPGYPYFETVANQEISLAIADWLSQVSHAA